MDIAKYKLRNFKLISSHVFEHFAVFSCASLTLQCGRNGSRSSSAPGGSQDVEQPQGLGHSEDAAEHENMKAVLRTSLGGSDKEVSGVPGLRTRTRSRPGRGGEADSVKERSRSQPHHEVFLLSVSTRLSFKTVYSIPFVII